MKKKEPFTIFGSKRTGDEESLMDGKEYSDRDSSNPLFDFHSIFSDKEITPSDKYNEVIGAKRRVYVACYLVLLLVSPLIFRYAMGSFSPDKTETIRFLLPDNATMTTTVDFEKCLECIDYDGVTVAEIGVAVANVTNPDKSGNIPSIAVFASQDFENWYSFYQPPSIMDAYVSNFDDTYFNVSSESLGCLGGVFSNYLVTCLNNRNLAVNLNLGESVGRPPFNDQCFQLTGVCGSPCIDSTTHGGQYPKNCIEGVIPMDLLVTNVSKQVETGSDNVVWGGNLHFIEWVVLMVLFFDTFGNILRGLPILSGRPSDINAARTCHVHGIAVLGHVTPIVSEDEVALLRSLIGRTATALRTACGRHSLQATYIDIIANEKRGEPNEIARFKLWMAWMDFITNIVEMSINAEKEIKSKEAASSGTEHKEVRFEEAERVVTDGSEPAVKILIDQIRLAQEIDIITDANEIVEAESEPAPNLNFGWGEDKSKRSITITKFFTGKSEKRESSRTTTAGQKKKQNPGAIIPDEQTHTTKSYTEEQLSLLLMFLDNWLIGLKTAEESINYSKPKSALTRVFGCAQVTSVFHNTTIFADVTTQFNELRQKFVDAMDNKLNYPSGHVYSYPLFPDEFTEISWSISRDPKKGYASWMIAWTYLSRSKLKEPPKNNKSQAGGSKILFDNHNSDEPDMLIQTTAKKPGAIVYLKCFGDEDTLGNWLGARLSPYKILSVQDNTVKLRRLRDNKITNKAEHQIELMEKNQGKAGALNVALMYFKRRGAIWCKKNNIDPETKQFLMGIVDARHMVLEPNIFWNDALPFLSGLRSCRPTTIFNRHSGENQMCLNVQYPQYFVNITEDYLDNRNGAYYTMGQTLRDCAKVTTSSGTNAIWDVSRRNFEFATTSRIEDTGTSHKYIAGAFSIHLPCFVAYGVAKTTNDYIEAVYRWSTGAVELFYASFFSSSDIIHFVFIGFICFCFWFACFAKSIFWYLIWLFILVVAMCKSNIDRNSGAKPLRNVVVSSVIVLNTMYWLSNLMSVVWMILMPICIAFYSKVPLSDSVERSLFWAFAAILLRLPTAIMYDQLAAMCRFLMPNTKVWSFNMLLWRSSQLYSCSAGYTALSIMTGTGNYIASRWSAKDLTSWSSFKVAETTVEEAKQKWLKTRKSTNWSMCSLAYWTTLLDYLLILIMSAYATMLTPEFWTTFVSIMLFFLQIVCLLVSIHATNDDDATALYVTILICGLNIFLVIDITATFSKTIGNAIGRPPRPEYVFASLAVIVILSVFLEEQSVSFRDIVKYLDISL